MRKIWLAAQLSQEGFAPLIVEAMYVRRSASLG